MKDEDIRDIFEILREKSKEDIIKNCKKETISKFKEINIFSDIIDKNGNITSKKLEEKNGDISNKELLTRYLYVSCVLDQGGDLEGQRLLLNYVTNELYKRDIKFLHKPQDFFDNPLIISQVIREQHSIVKSKRKDEWAKEINPDNPRPNSYSLFRIQRTPSSQLTPYVLFKWGVPLMNIMKIQEKFGSLFNYVSSFRNPQDAVDKIRTDKEFGLGRAIGWKADFLFIKYIIHVFELISKKGWTKNSFEVPFDSNIGRVLFRIGYVDYFLDEKEKNKTLRERKEGIHLEANELRNKKIKEEINPSTSKIYQDLKEIVLPIDAPKTKPGFQFTINWFLENIGDTDLTIGSFDDSLMYIGTKFCKNKSPDCENCPLNSKCSKLINIRTD